MLASWRCVNILLAINHRRRQDEVDFAFWSNPSEVGHFRAKKSPCSVTPEQTDNPLCVSKYASLHYIHKLLVIVNIEHCHKISWPCGVSCAKFGWPDGVFAGLRALNDIASVERRVGCTEQWHYWHMYTTRLADPSVFPHFVLVSRISRLGQQSVAIKSQEGTV